MTAKDSPSSYEHDRAELEEVVHKLELGGVPLEESLALWERGEALAKQCQEWLDGARRRLDAARDATPETTAGVSPSAGEDSAQ